MLFKKKFSIFYTLLFVISSIQSTYGWKFLKHSPSNTLQQLKQHGSKVVTLVFDPAGTSGQHQRMINGISEQTITYQLVLALKKKLEESNPYLRIIILRDTKSDNVLEHISTANQTHANLYINFQAYHSKLKKNSLDIYHMQYRSTDSWSTTENITTLLPIDMSHKLTITTTLLFEKILIDTMNDQKVIQATALGLPVKQLLGLTLPALLLEIGLINNDSYDLFIDPLARAFTTIISIITDGAL